MSRGGFEAELLWVLEQQPWRIARRSTTRTGSTITTIPIQQQRLTIAQTATIGPKHTAASVGAKVGALKRSWAILSALGGIIAAWWAVDRWLRGRHDQDASAAENEAAKVREAGKSGKTDEVLDSFRRATDK